MVLKILNKAKPLANTAKKVSIVSTMTLKKHPGRIFVEAFAENDEIMYALAKRKKNEGLHPYSKQWISLIVNNDLEDIRPDNINADDFFILEENGKDKDYQDFGLRDFDLIDDEDDDYGNLKFT